MLATYAVRPDFVLGGRLEYETSAGTGAPNATNLLYGPGSGAASTTLTPTYLKGHWFLQTELSAAGIVHGLPGEGFGREGNGSLQLRAMLEGGYVF